MTPNAASNPVAPVCDIIVNFHPVCSSPKWRMAMLLFEQQWHPSCKSKTLSHGTAQAIKGCDPPTRTLRQGFDELFDH
jgi:hypothetical protein